MKSQPQLTLKQYRILRQKGAEPPFSGKLLYNKEKGVYCCARCGRKLFSSDMKFDSGTGWPSFYDVNKGAIELKDDSSLGMKRTEVVRQNCGGHLGHRFNDGPPPTGKRYCINSASLVFAQKT